MERGTETPRSTPRTRSGDMLAPHEDAVLLAGHLRTLEALDGSW